MVRPTLDSSHEELKRILEELISSDVDVTVREVARRHSSLKNASAFTRNLHRAELIESAKQRQVDARNMASKPVVEKAAGLAQRLAEKVSRVQEQQTQIEHLVASHVACIRAVMRHGGMQSVLAFWKEYDELARTLNELGALPEGAKVIDLHRSSAVPSKE